MTTVSSQDDHTSYFTELVKKVTEEKVNVLPCGLDAKYKKAYKDAAGLGSELGGSLRCMTAVYIAPPEPAQPAPPPRGGSCLQRSATTLRVDHTAAADAPLAKLIATATGTVAGMWTPEGIADMNRSDTKKVIMRATDLLHGPNSKPLALTRQEVIAALEVLRHDYTDVLTNERGHRTLAVMFGQSTVREKNVARLLSKA